MTRRTFNRLVGGTLPFGMSLLRAKESPSLSWVAQPDPGAGVERHYRADAVVVVLSVPLLHRNGVGDGSAIWRESIAADGAVVRLLEFTGRSVPEHAAGLNRFGFIQELSRTVDRVYKESLYFGLMTASPEETAAEARKSLHAKSQDASFSVIDGRIAPGCIETSRAHFVAPARTSPADRKSLIERARQALVGAPEKTEEFQATEATPRPFLHAIVELLSRPDCSITEYAYNGLRYTLRVERSPDSKTAAAFRERLLIPPAAMATRISGTLKRKGGDKSIEFRLWIEEGAARPLPLRIEYQPKPYLRLVFEALS